MGPQDVAVFDLYGVRSTLEKKLNDWLHAEPQKKILSVLASDSRLFIRWQPGNGHRHGPTHFKLFSIQDDAKRDARIREFFAEHPNPTVIFEACNWRYIFWFWADDTA